MSLKAIFSYGVEPEYAVLDAWRDDSGLVAIRGQVRAKRRSQKLKFLRSTNPGRSLHARRSPSTTFAPRSRR